MSFPDSEPRGGAAGYAQIELENEKFERYLREILESDEGGLKACLETMREPLPVTFRVLKPDGEFEKQMASLQAVGITATPVPFCPQAWQLNTGRKAMRRSPEMAAFHSWLVDACESGQVVRQEAVSMIPPLCLQAQPGDRVIDMCAAPGSKTSQLIQAVNAPLGSDQKSCHSLVVANDADRNRAYMLYHQVRRLCSPCLLVTQYDATRIPKALGLFDRVLCDVPCSGDGTVRKNPLLWREWSPKSAIGLHPLQRRILQKGIDLMRGTRDARLVYSTCSLNPIENEAVVASLLADNPDMELLDPRPLLCGLKSSPGLSNWRVVSPDGGTFFDAFDSVPGDLKMKLKPSMFPPTAVSAMNLHHTVRIYPHLQDSGGFFVALFARRTEKPDEHLDLCLTVVKKKAKVAADSILVPIPEQLGAQLISHFFTQDLSPYGALVTRSSSCKGLQFVNKGVSGLLDFVGQQGMLVNAGVSAFDLYSGHCDPDVVPYRLVGECLKPLGHLLKTSLVIDIQDATWFCTLLDTEGSVDLPLNVNGTGSLVLRHGAILIPVWCMSRSRVKAFVPKLERPLLKNALLNTPQ
jgi:16S rRNA C967 or C1407 C5-methylase (RsmB/RsmF family)